MKANAATAWCRRMLLLLSREFSHDNSRTARFAARLFLLSATLSLFGGAPDAATVHPFYQRRLPTPQRESDFAGDNLHIDFSKVHTDLSATSDPVGEAKRLFDKRAAAAVRNSVAVDLGVLIFPEDAPSNRDLLEIKAYGEEAPTIYIPTGKCLAAMAYLDYFPDSPWKGLRSMVSTAIMQASPGWAGTFGPGVDAATDLFGDHYEGNYDMTQMRLLMIAYKYYDELTPEARERLIIELLAHGTVHRPNIPDQWMHGLVPEDWSRAGFVSPLGIHIRIGETENHILMILTVRYLTNQLLYQANPLPEYDNRRNGDDHHPSGTGLVLLLLQRILRNDFSEYNAKNYQLETRWALLNLASFAYDPEVRLAARMALDYISAHIAVSSSDLRRMVPFRRRNEGRFITQLPGGVMDVGLLDWTLGADPMSEAFAIQSGNLRALASPNLRTFDPENKFTARPWEWAIASDGNEGVIEALSEYRLPPSIHDLFVNDLHRRFFQRLHRVAEDLSIEVGSDRNADNMEIYAGSASYLISAGGAPGPWAIDPSLAGALAPEGQLQQLGAAVTTSFMPAGETAGPGTQNNARDLIQFSQFSDGFTITDDGEVTRTSPTTANYGVAPDFACGHKVYLPQWVLAASEADGRFLFVNKGSSQNGQSNRPGFYLAIFRDGEFACMEAFDTWLHPGLTYAEFKSAVKANNPGLRLQSNIEAQYTTMNGNRLRFVIWNNSERDNAVFGAKIVRIDYGSGDPTDRLGDAGNLVGPFLNGTILNSPRPAVVEITNPYLGTKITLDLSDPWHPRRVSETGQVEEVTPGSEVWVNFSWTGPSEGDVYRPFKSLTAAIAAVAPGGVIKIAPGTTSETLTIPRGKRFRIEAPIGGVWIGAR